MANKSVIDSMGVLAISSRLQRLCDGIRREGAQIYKEHGVEFEPKWFPVVVVLNDKGSLSIVDIANEIGLAHPSVIQLVKELEEKNLVKSSSHKTDKRKRLLTLTPKAKQLLKKMQPVWNSMIKSLEEVTDTKNNLMKAMDEVEENLRKESFQERTNKILKAKKTPK